MSNVNIYFKQYKSKSPTCATYLEQAWIGVPYISKHGYASASSNFSGVLPGALVADIYIVCSRSLEDHYASKHELDFCR